MSLVEEHVMELTGRLMFILWSTGVEATNFRTTGDTWARIFLWALRTDPSEEVIDTSVRNLTSKNSYITDSKLWWCLRAGGSVDIFEALNTRKKWTKKKSGRWKYLNSNVNKNKSKPVRRCSSETWILKQIRPSSKVSAKSSWTEKKIAQSEKVYIYFIAQMQNKQPNTINILAHRYFFYTILSHCIYYKLYEWSWLRSRCLVLNSSVKAEECLTNH